MNDLGVLLLHAIVQSTAFLLLGIALYSLSRRFGPALGASTALGSLVVLIGVTLMTLSPWPRWRLPDLTAVTVSRNEPTASVPAKAMPNQGEKPAVESATAAVEVVNAPSTVEPNIPSSFLEVIRQAAALMPVAPPSRQGWSWPAWFAGFILAMLGIGSARLMIGLWGMRRLRSSGVRIDNPGLVDLVEILRAEMSCRRPVALREVDGLATPATVGWIRPVVLLPDDWRTWDEPERRAVLAHELAHVCRNDFLAGLVAQFSLTVHFYNPLAHWLSARFRLEQELAADAWGSGLSGGKASYLMTLARLALERDRRASSWPVRAFLPSRGTFVRRIEMLRDAKSIRHVPITWRFRSLAFGTLALLGLLIAGIRAPIGETTVLAQAPESKKSEPAPAPSNKPFNLKYVPAEANFVFALKPAELLAYPEFKELFDKFRGTQAFKQSLLNSPEEIDQLIAFADIGSMREPPDLYPNFVDGYILRANRAQDWHALLDRLDKDPESIRYEGAVYTRAKISHPHPLCCYSPDDRTLIIAAEEPIRMAIEDREAPPPRHAWDEVWPKVEKSQAALALETRWLRRYAADYHRRAAGRTQLPYGFTFEAISPLFEKARGYAAGANLSPGFTLDIEAVCGTDTNAKSVAETAQAVLTLGRNLNRRLSSEQPASPKESREAMKWLVTTLGSILDHATIAASGKTANLQTKGDFDLSHWSKFIAPAIVSSQQGRLRHETVNHLKRIGLAFHNYHSTYNHFPSPVLYGGKSGKVPYSWRVAILPFVEQQKLYDQYNFDEPWDGPNNRKLIDKMPAVYSYPLIDGSPSSTTNSSYYVLTGPHTALAESTVEVNNTGRGRGGRDQGPFEVNVPRAVSPEARFPAGISAITDGTSNTILAVEAKRDIPWTKPEDLPFEVGPTQPRSFGGFWPDGFNALFCDGSVRSLKNSIDPTVLGALLTRDGGEVISHDAF
jgi:prepilin-type processing-associated H-X9-DG protein